MPDSHWRGGSIFCTGINCLFLDVCGPGSGGPDFRLGKPQAEWLTSHLENAKSNDQKSVVFTHTYPADLKDSNEARLLNNVLYANDVLLVDMGHTHYNDLANNGKTIFAATRSTGQIEEGPVGYSLVSVDNGSVGWRFRPLHDAFPFVMITSPADHRLQPDSLPQQNEFIEVHAVVFGRRTVKQVKCRADKQEWTIMTLCEDKITWAAQITHTDASALTVMATDESGRPGMHIIELRGASNHQPKRICNGSDADSIGAWPENGIFGTQLGPNKNGKPS